MGEYYRAAAMSLNASGASTMRSSVSRAYDNDVVINDPYVAPHHIRIFRDESGAGRGRGQTAPTACSSVVASSANGAS